MKSFNYFESTEGGMHVYENIKGPEDLSFIRGWMKDICKKGDMKMIKWMEEAEIGEMFSHRLGCLVRMADI